ncbi:MAG: GGDEF domain-containing protein [Actinomycetota bacterium]
MLALAEAIGAGVDVTATLAAAAAVLREATGADRAIIAMCDPERGFVADVVTTDPATRGAVERLGGQPAASLPFWRGLTGGSGLLAAPATAGVLEPAARADLRADAALAMLLRHPTVTRDDRPAPLGVAVCAWDAARDEFPREVLRLARTLAGQTAVAVAGAHNRAQAAALSDRLSELVAWAARLSSAERPAEVLSLVAHAASELLAAPFISVVSEGAATHRPTSLPGGARADDAVARMNLAAAYAVHDAGAAPPAVAGALGALALDWLLVADSADRSCRLAAGRAAMPGTVEERVARLLVDVTAEAVRRARAYERLARLAVTDPLTGLGNRAAFEGRLAEAVSHSLRYARPLAFVVIDVDLFRNLNERGGHPLGDDCLRAVADAIRTEVRGADIAYRIGGDEFALVLPETTAHGATALLERVAARVRSDAPEPVGLTMGVAQCPDDAGTAEELYRRADLALFAGKRAGRGVIRRAGE